MEKEIMTSYGLLHIIKIKSDVELRESLNPVKVETPIHLYDAIIKTGIVKSRGDIKQLMDSIHVDGLTLRVWMMDEESLTITDKGYTMVWKGKRPNDPRIIHFT